MRLARNILGPIVVGLAAASMACQGGGSATITAATATQPPIIQPNPMATITPLPAVPDATGVVGSATPTLSPTPTAAPAPAGLIRTAIPGPPTHWDPHRDTSPALLTWGMGMVYDRVMRFTDGASDNTGENVGYEGAQGRVVCNLCESWEMTSPTILAMQLRSDVRWQDIGPLDGRRLTAADIVFSLGRQTEPGFPNAAILATMTGIEATGEFSLEFEMRRPDAEFLEALADSHSVIVAPEAVEARGDLLTGPSVGTGPWMWRDTTDSMAAYTANPNYFRVGSPGVERLEILYLSEGTRFATLVTGQVDFLRLEEPDALRAVDRNPDLLVSRNRVAGTGVEFAINAGRPLMGTSAARQAILAAVAPYETVSEVWGDSGFVAVGLPVGNPGWLLPESEVKGILGRFAGQGVLSIAGGDLGTLKVGLFDDRVTEHAGIIADSLIAMGANVEIETITTRQFGDEVWFGGQYDMFLGFQPPISSFSNLLFSVYHSQGAWNTTGVSSPELDSLIEQQAVEQDPESRRNMALEIQRTILKDAHRIGAASRADGWVYWPHITGFTASLPRGAPDFLARIRTE